MKSTIQFFFFAALVLLTSNNSYASATNGTMVSAKQIKNYKQISSYWQAPATNQYKLWLQMPNDNTEGEINYFIYPNGTSKRNKDCLSNDNDYPCFSITLNHAANQNKWQALLINNDNKTVWNFSEKGFIRAIGQASHAVISFEEAYPLTIGKNYQGGIIFYLDASKKHGLIAAPNDLKDSLANIYVTWYNGSFSTTGATSVSNGKENTSAIVLNQGIGDYAAKLCDDLVIDEYSDWYLPSRDELDLMYRNIGHGALAPFTNVGNFLSSGYWSSSEVDNYSAWGQDFESGEALNYYEGNNLLVRAIRAF